MSTQHRRPAVRVVPLVALLTVVALALAGFDGYRIVRVLCASKVEATAVGHYQEWVRSSSRRRGTRRSSSRRVPRTYLRLDDGRACSIPGHDVPVHGRLAVSASNGSRPFCSRGGLDEELGILLRVNAIVGLGVLIFLLAVFGNAIVVLRRRARERRVEVAGRERYTPAP